MFEKKEHQNSGALGKDTINHWIIPFLSVEKRFSFNNGAQLAFTFLPYMFFFLFSTIDIANAYGYKVSLIQKLL